MTPLEEARKLLRLASQDERVLDKLIADLEISDAVWAFHAQQAAEKLLKAVLLRRGVVFPKTHDLALLYQLVVPIASVPVSLDELDTLSPYAVGYRYDELETEPLDRTRVRQLIAALRSWAESVVA